MGNKFKCKMCKENYNMLTKEKLCAFCYKEKYKKWSPDFSKSKKEQEK